jgi:hypothetical protein
MDYIIIFIFTIFSLESAAIKRKVFGGKKAKEKRENVTRCFKETKRKGRER